MPTMRKTTFALLALLTIAASAHALQVLDSGTTNEVMNGVAAAPAISGESRAAVISTGVAQVTGLAISPLLVLVAIGLADFFRLGGFSAESGTLPLHANPWLLIPCATLLLGLGLKKFASPMIPLPLRKVLDACEYFEAKLSALVAAGILLPSIITTMAAVSMAPSDPTNTAAVGGFLTQAMPSDAVGFLLAVPAVLVIFVCVWITFHVIDALIVLSPFAILDAILVTIRVSILATLGIALLISPYLSMLICVPLIVLSFFIAGWCVRLDLFALSIASDLLFMRDGAAESTGKPLRAYLAARGHGAPIRTMGHAEPSGTGVRFTYKPYFVMPPRSLEIPVARPLLVRGLLWSTLRDEGVRGVISLPPRYRRHDVIVAARFRAALRDGIARRSWHGIRDAFAGIVSPSAATERAAQA